MNRDKHESPTFPHQPHAVFQSGLRTEFTGEMFRNHGSMPSSRLPAGALSGKVSICGQPPSLLSFFSPLRSFHHSPGSGMQLPHGHVPGRCPSAVRPRQSSALIIPQHVPRIRTIPEEPASAASMSGVTAPLRRACCSCSRIRDVKNRSASSSCNLTAKKRLATERRHPPNPCAVFPDSPPIPRIAPPKALRRRPCAPSQDAPLRIRQRNGEDIQNLPPSFRSQAASVTNPGTAADTPCPVRRQ